MITPLSKQGGRRYAQFSVTMALVAVLRSGATTTPIVTVDTVANLVVLVPADDLVVRV